MEYPPFLNSSPPQIHEAVTSRRRSFKGASAGAPVLVSLAVEAGELAQECMDSYTPALREWCPSAGAVAAAVVHACYYRELKQFLNTTTVLTQEAAQVGGGWG